MRSKCDLQSMRGSKGILHFLIMFALVFAVALAVSATANAEDVIEVDEASDLAGPGNYKLIKDIVTSDTWGIVGTDQEPVTATLDLNGFGIRKQNSGSVISVGTNATLTIEDSNDKSTHYITLEDWLGTKVASEGEESDLDNGTGTVIVSGGYITGGMANSHGVIGGGISVTGGNSDVPGGQVIMNGGTIIGNTKEYVLDNDYGGGGVAVDGRGKFEMKGGAITSNHSVNGGGVALHGNGKFVQDGGKISGNDASANGGGVYATGNGATFELNSGSVDANATVLGGGVSVRGHGILNMTGGSISGNTAYGNGGGIYLQRDGDPQEGTGLITVSGGKVADNVATENGGGIYVQGGVFNLSGDPEIKDNKEKIKDGTAPSNVALANDQKITITGKLTNTTPIGIKRNEGIFTTGLNDNGTANNFVSNREGLGVYPVTGNDPDSGEAQLGTDEWKSLQNALLGVKDGDTINVRDFDFDTDYKITAGNDDTCLEIWGANNDGDDPKKVTLNLNGVTLDRGLSDGEAAEDGCVLNLHTILDLTIIGTSVDNHVGTITGGNFLDSRGGGGIKIGTDVSLTLQDGEVTGNKTTGNGGGIFVAGKLTLKGAPKITDNQAGEDSDNVYLTTNNNKNATITVTDNLENAKGEKAEVGVTTETEPTGANPVAITGKVPNPYSVADKFSSDKEYLTLQRKAVVYLAVPVTVTYDKNLGEAKGEMEDQIIGGSINTNLNKNKFTCGDRQFKGWNTKADGTGTAYTDEQEVTLTEDTTLYAQWAKDISAKVTFKVVNGAWNDGTTADKTVTLKGYEGETLKLSADQIPAAGNKPGEAYKAGSWDKVPEKDSVITGDVTYTYTYEAKPVPSVSPEKKKDTPAKVAKILIPKMAPKGKNGLKVSWKKIYGAEGYDIFFSRCNNNDKIIKIKKVKTIKGKAISNKNILTWTKKGLNKKTPYKVRVKAWVMKNGKKKYIKTSPLIHAFTSGGSAKYTNARKVTVRKTKISLKKGKTYKVKANVKKLYQGRKLMKYTHAHKLRYMSSDAKVAKVNAKGRIRGISKGTCKVYVYAHNGVYKKISVTVK